MWIRLFLFLILASIDTYGDGGILKKFTLPMTEDGISWPIEPLGMGMDQLADFELEDQSKIEGYPISFYAIEEHELWGFFSNESYPRLFIDSNDDGKYQIVEGHRGEPIGEPSTSYSQYRFRNVIFPIPVNPSQEASGKSLFLQVNMTGNIYNINKEKYVSIQCERFLTYFAGTLRLGDKEFPAHLLFRSLPSYRDTSTSLLILDTHLDNDFHPVDDLWFSTQGIAYIENSIWSVLTTFRENEAEVSLTPYQGPTGTLKMEGTGILKVAFQSPRTLTQGENRTPMDEFTLPFKEDLTYTLPAASYNITKVWLTPNEESETLYQSSVQLFESVATLTIQENQTVTQWIGGPLTTAISVKMNRFLGRLSLEYMSCKNQAGLKFAELQKDNINGGDSLPPPSWEIRDKRGTIIRSGSFAYG